MSDESINDNLQEHLSQSAGYLLSRTSGILRGKVTNALVPLQLSLYEYVCLRLISINAPLSQGSLGDIYGIDRATMVVIIDKLESRELILRERNSADRRSYRLRLTPKGAKVLSRAKRIVAKQQKEFLEPLSEQEWDTLRTLLVKLVNNRF
jgi:DNA-binding MarR family transcriptional regulator